MITLAVAAIAWLALHVVVAGMLRPHLVARLGERRYLALFSLASLLLLIALIGAYKAAPVVPLWNEPGWARAWAFVWMLPAVLLLVLALTPASPTSVGAQERHLEARGVFRITRHPMLNAFLLWALAHLPANGELGMLIVLAAIGLTAANGMFSIDLKRARVGGEAWTNFAHETSRLPFVAILRGRNRLAAEEIPAWRVGAAFVVYVVMIAVHGALGHPLL